MGLTVRRFEVELFGQTMLLHGVIESFRRLSDLVNEGEPYFAMSEVESYPYAGHSLVGVDQHSRGLVSKDMVVMLSETGEAATSETPASVEVVAKVPHRVLVYTSHFAINADIHLVEGAELHQFLTSSQGKFMAVTNATVTPTGEGTQLTSFSRKVLIINRAYIAFFGTEQTRPAGTAPVQAGTIG